VQTVVPTSLRYLVAIDAGESMHYGGVLGGGSLVTPLVASAAMALVVARSETEYQVVALSGAGIEPLPVTPASTLADACTLVARVRDAERFMLCRLSWNFKT
jgi:uncharacterized protein (DUF58 family)